MTIKAGSPSGEPALLLTVFLSRLIQGVANGKAAIGATKSVAIAIHEESGHPVGRNVHRRVGKFVVKAKVAKNTESGRSAAIADKLIFEVRNTQKRRRLHTSRGLQRS